MLMPCSVFVSVRRPDELTAWGRLPNPQAMNNVWGALPDSRKGCNCGAVFCMFCMRCAVPSLATTFGPLSIRDRYIIQDYTMSRPRISKWKQTALIKLKFTVMILSTELLLSSPVLLFVASPLLSVVPTCFISHLVYDTHVLLVTG